MSTLGVADHLPCCWGYYLAKDEVSVRSYEEVQVLVKLYEEVEVGNMEGALLHS